MRRNSVGTRSPVDQPPLSARGAGWLAFDRVGFALTAETDTLALGLMTKFWDPGQVKTRLGASIGMSRAAALHQLFVRHLCVALAHTGDRRTVCLAPDHRVEAFEQQLRSWIHQDGWQPIPQGDGDLGQRIQRWFTRALALGRDGSMRAILIGGDCPTLSADQITRAGLLLHIHDLVLGPAVDGGYYLIGLRGPWQTNESRYATLFDNIPWSTDQVFRLTRQRALSAGLSVGLLEQNEDVDTIDELNRLRERLRDGGRGLSYLHSEVERILDSATPIPDDSSAP